MKDLKATQTRLKARMDALQTALENQENPLSAEESAAMVEQYNEVLMPRFEANKYKLQTILDTREGVQWELSVLKKQHARDLRNSKVYRKQVASYCSRM